MWVTGIIMPAISIFVYYDAGLYADFGINIYYCIAAIYGFLVWQFSGKFSRFFNRKRAKNDGEERFFNKEETKNDVKETKKSLPITRTPRRKYGQLTLCFVLCFILIGITLNRYTDSTVPWWDSFTTSLSIVGMWMLARKWIEQWWVWVAVDAVSTFLYIYKGIYFYAALYGIYTIIAIYGYFKWKRLMS